MKNLPEVIYQDPLYFGVGLGVVLLVVAAYLLLRRRRRLEEARREALEEEPTAGFPEPAPPEPAPPEPPRVGLLDRLTQGLQRTRDNLGRQLDQIFGRSVVDEGLFQELEEALLMADVGVKASAAVVEALQEQARRERIQEPEELRRRLQEHLVAILEETGPEPPPVGDGPRVILVVGVNGGGKTTTIGKLAARYARGGAKVVLGAGDTYRAGAIQQLRVWAERGGVDIVAHDEGADPAAVLHDTLRAALARGYDVAICDTAGRLQSRKPLMEQLSKITRVIGKVVPGAPHEVLLVLDATIGQNAVSQARLFGEAVGLTGVVLTKLDGTAKGGVVVAVRGETGLPVRYVGVGEKIDDLKPFDAQTFVAALLEPPGSASNDGGGR